MTDMQDLLDASARANELLLHVIARSAKASKEDPEICEAILTSVLENCDAEDLLDEDGKEGCADD